MLAHNVPKKTCLGRLYLIFLQFSVGKEKKNYFSGNKMTMCSRAWACIKNAKFNSFRHVSPENHSNGRKL